MSRKHLVRAVTLVATALLVLPLALAAPGLYGGEDGPPLRVAVPPSFPQDGSPPSEPWQVQIPEQPVPTYPNLEYHLDQLAAGVERGEVSPRQAASETERHDGAAVFVSFWLSGNVDGVVEFLEANGGDVRYSGEGYIEAYVPVTLLGPASEQPGVLRVSEVMPPEPAQESPPTDSQGLQAHGAESWHAAGYRGEGVKVGILDLGFPGFRELQGSELPERVAARCYTEPNLHTPFLSDCERYLGHGAAVAESLVDIAPGVELYISTPISPGELKDAVGWMVSEGVSVISDSTVWTFDGPGDGNSPVPSSPLNTVDDIVDSGAIYVNSAGNYAKQTWFARPPRTDNRGYVLFQGSATGNPMVLEAGQSVRLQLRWEDAWGGATRDYDLLLWDIARDQLWQSTRNVQGGGPGHIPYEMFRFEAPAVGLYMVLIRYNRGGSPSWMQLMVWGADIGYFTRSGSVANPGESDNPGLLAVGAAPWYYPHTIEPFSSRGPAPDGRVKPDITGADCGATMTVPEKVETRPGCWFLGTSQAAPHVAGLAALVRQRFPDYTPDQVAGYLNEQASPRGEVPNTTWGHGFAQLPMIAGGPAPGPTPTDPCGVAVTGDGTLSGEWAEGCESEVSGRGYARYFSFTLAEGVGGHHHPGVGDRHLPVPQGGERPLRSGAAR